MQGNLYPYSVPLSHGDFVHHFWSEAAVEYRL